MADTFQGILDALHSTNPAAGKGSFLKHFHLGRNFKSKIKLKS